MPLAVSRCKHQFLCHIPCGMGSRLFPSLPQRGLTLELATVQSLHQSGAKDVPAVVWGTVPISPDLWLLKFEARPRIPSKSPGCFLKTSRALIDVYEGEITLRVGKEAITFNLDQTLSVKEYAQDLSFSDSVAYGNPSPCFDPIVANSSPTLTPLGEIDPTYNDPQWGHSHPRKAYLNNEPPTPIPNQGDCSPETQEEIKLCEAKTVKSSIDEPPEVELKDLPPHLEYAFLEDDNNFQQQKGLIPKTTIVIKKKLEKLLDRRIDVIPNLR
ncbi:hypothetical protein Tco_1316236 [Tanacetum coccineum]